MNIIAPYAYEVFNTLFRVIREQFKSFANYSHQDFPAFANLHRTASFSISTMLLTCPKLVHGHQMWKPKQQLIDSGAPTSYLDHDYWPLLSL
jgi:hypothetical protein